MTAMFVLDHADYKRNIDLVPAYIDDNALYLARQTGRPLSECRAYVERTISPAGAHPFKDPEIMYLAAETRGNRAKYIGTFSEYLQTVTDRNLLMAPNLTVYHPVSVKKSLVAEYIDGNLKLRSKYKKSKFVAMMEGDKAREALYENLQTTCKIKNNSVSGAHASSHNPLYNKSAHSTLTSTCRMATSYSNASNERFLMGNRHYWCPDVVLANLLTTINTTDMAAVELAVYEYGLHQPTVADTMECITYSSNLYWNNAVRLARIESFVSNMSGLERAAFVYTGDFYHIAKHNPAFVHAYLAELAQPAPELVDTGDFLKNNHDEDLTTLAMMLCAESVNGILLNKLAPEVYALVDSTAYRCNEIFKRFTPFIVAFLRPSTLPPSAAAIQSIVRRCVMTSDTDSTIFTTQYWTEWHTGSLNFRVESNRIRDVMSYMVSRTVANMLALYVVNLGVPANQIHQLAMKNEYCFPTFTLTSMAKHYFAWISAQEGNVFQQMKFDMKGMNLRASNAPPEVTAMLREWTSGLMTLFMRDGTVSIHDLLRPIYDLEISIMEDIRRGGHKYLKSARVNDSSSYVKGAEAPALQYYRFWNSVYGDTHGECPEPPYRAIKLSLDLENKTAVEAWLAGMENRVVAARIQTWMTENRKVVMPSIQLPLEIVQQGGIPTELLDAMKMRKLVFNIVQPFYLVLESFGIYMMTKRISRLISDEYVPMETVPKGMENIALSGVIGMISATGAAA